MGDKVRGRGSLGREKANPACRVSEATSRQGVFTGPRQRGADRSPHLVVITNQDQSTHNVLSRSGVRTSEKTFHEVLSWFWHDERTNGAEGFSRKIT